MFFLHKTCFNYFAEMKRPPLTNTTVSTKVTWAGGAAPWNKPPAYNVVVQPTIVNWKHAVWFSKLKLDGVIRFIQTYKCTTINIIIIIIFYSLHSQVNTMPYWYGNLHYPLCWTNQPVRNREGLRNAPSGFFTN